MRTIERRTTYTGENEGEIDLILMHKNEDLRFTFGFDERNNPPGTHSPFPTPQSYKIAYPKSLPEKKLQNLNKSEIVSLNLTLPNRHDNTDIILVDKPISEYSTTESPRFDIQNHVDIELQ
jgi:hypothetical protein